MPKFRTSRTVPFAAKAMFDLVADVEAYPQFLPLCLDLKVRRRTVAEDGRQTVVADMVVGYKAIRESFTSRVTCDPANLAILVEYIDGPFQHLENRWHFEELGPELSKIEFDIAYEFRSRALALIVGNMFETAFRKFAEAFENRAALVYGSAV